MNNSNISLVVAVAHDSVIGFENRLPWRLPEDVKFFKNLTWGNIVVMGRKTYESIGKTLPARLNIVFSGKKIDSDVITVSGLGEFMELKEQMAATEEWQDKEIFVIGGESIFKLFLPYAQRIYLTRIYEKFEGDTFFPLFQENEWKLVYSEKGIRDKKNPYDYEFQIYERKN